MDKINVACDVKVAMYSIKATVQRKRTYWVQLSAELCKRIAHISDKDSSNSDDKFSTHSTRVLEEQYLRPSFRSVAPLRSDPAFSCYRQSTLMS